MRLIRALTARWRMPAALARLQKHSLSPAVLNALGNTIVAAHDRELYHANPRYLADRLGLDERTMLHLIVVAAAEGVLNLDWQTNCPVCKYYGRTAGSLAGLAGLHVCANCDHHYEVNLDDEASAIVSVHENLRRLSPRRRDDAVFRVVVDARFGRLPAIRLINTPMFRRLLTDETLGAGQQLGVKRLAVFSADLRGVLGLYRRLGDAAAYPIVNEFFQAVSSGIARHQGTVVQFVGDRLMGAFVAPADALAGLSEAMSEVERLNRKHGLAGDDRVALRAGLHAGPCLVVSLNGRLDYVGETVNHAADLNEAALDGEIILTQTALADEAACQRASALGALTPVARSLPGWPEPAALYRLIPTFLEA